MSWSPPPPRHLCPSRLPYTPGIEAGERGAGHSRLGSVPRFPGNLWDRGRTLPLRAVRVATMRRLPSAVCRLRTRVSAVRCALCALRCAVRCAARLRTTDCGRATRPSLCADDRALPTHLLRATRRVPMGMEMRPVPPVGTLRMGDRCILGRPERVARGRSPHQRFVELTARSGRDDNTGASTTESG